MDIQIPQILFQLINFGVVMGALTYLLYKPVRKMLEERSSRIEEAQKAAEVTLAEKRNIEELKRDAKQKAEREAKAIVDQAAQDAEMRGREIIAKAEKTAQAAAEKTKQAAQDEKKAMMEAARNEFTDAVIAAVEKIGATFDKKTHEKIITAELDQLLQQI